MENEIEKSPPSQAREGSDLHNNQNAFQDNKGFGSLVLHVKPTVFLILYQLVLSALENYAENGFVTFYDVDIAVRDIELSHDERVRVMKELERAGLVELVGYKGWRLRTATHLNNSERGEES